VIEFEETNNSSEDSPTNIRTFSVVLSPSSNWVAAGALLLDAGWLSRLSEVFDPNAKLIRQSIDADAAQKATLLCHMLRTRMRSSRYMKRVKPERWNHWSLEWAAENMTIPAAYMVHFIHVKKNITCLGELRCLLAKPNTNNFFMASNEEGKLSGCYLGYDTNSDEFIRSGKSTGVKGCVGRWAEHRTKAESDRNDADCDFYDLFPSRKSPRSKGKIEGIFEDLEQYVAAGFEREAVVESGIFRKDYRDGGIFFFSKQQRERIERLNFNGRTSVEKYSEMVAYLFELAYDLALGPMNVSGSTGFEGCGLNL
jgi:hypothetical protein